MSEVSLSEQDIQGEVKETKELGAERVAERVMTGRFMETLQSNTDKILAMEVGQTERLIVESPVFGGSLAMGVEGMVGYKDLDEEKKEKLQTALRARFYKTVNDQLPGSINHQSRSADYNMFIGLADRGEMMPAIEQFLQEGVGEVVREELGVEGEIDPADYVFVAVGMQLGEPMKLAVIKSEQLTRGEDGTEQTEEVYTIATELSSDVSMGAVLALTAKQAEMRESVKGRLPILVEEDINGDRGEKIFHQKKKVEVRVSIGGLSEAEKSAPKPPMAAKSEAKVSERWGELAGKLAPDTYMKMEKLAAKFGLRGEDLGKKEITVDLGQIGVSEERSEAVVEGLVAQAADITGYTDISARLVGRSEELRQTTLELVQRLSVMMVDRSRKAGNDVDEVGGDGNKSIMVPPPGLNTLRNIMANIEVGKEYSRILAEAEKSDDSNQVEATRMIKEEVHGYLKMAYLKTNAQIRALPSGNYAPVEVKLAEDPDVLLGQHKLMFGSQPFRDLLAEKDLTPSDVSMVVVNEEIARELLGVEGNTLKVMRTGDNHFFVTDAEEFAKADWTRVGMSEVK